MSIGQYKWGRRLFSLCLIMLFSISFLHMLPVLGDTNDQNRFPGDLVYVIPVQQTIESGLEKFLVRAFKEAHKANARHIILDLNTFGGTVDSATNIGELIRNSSIPTVAYVNGKAISAGSYIALNADQIVMGRGSSIGSAAVVTISGDRVEDSKTVSVWVGLMSSAAELNGRNPDYAAAMVNDQLNVTVEEIGKTFAPGVLLNFTAEEAVLAGYAEAVATNLQEVLSFIGVQGGEIIVVEAGPAEKLARFLTNPVVMTILMLIGIAGVAIELFVPGFGLPGIIGIAAFVLYFFGHFVAGFAGLEHILLFVAGVVLLLIEMFLPSFGVLGILGLIGIISGVILAAYDTGQAALSLTIAFVLAIVVIVIVVRLFKHKGIWNRFILKDQFTDEEGYTSQQSKDHLLNKTGVAITPLRPSGTALIDDERVDVVTSGEFIANKERIVVYKIEGTRVVVRAVQNDE